ncbi:non-ribosomal peptide synthetase [Streptomyces sp. CB02923]|uniref:non-ribosomal peptide synthetase n=1 Tax=Streptomyces sp. CB02923 TaxID=1718985 RepID=UPI0009A0EC1B|nr:non-ribosomal peptide synthetase [Streptomyces sp. CB02923]
MTEYRCGTNSRGRESDSPAELVRPGSIQEGFAAQLARSPDAPAVSAPHTCLTYRQLDERAGRLARLLADSGVGPETPVAVLMERSADLVVATLAVLKSGGYYVPLHLAHPPERLRRIMAHHGSPLLLTDEAGSRRGVRASRTVVVGPGHELPDRSGPPPQPPADPDQLAYVIHTSGSTGEPKGVAVAQRDVLALVHDSCWEASHHERVLMLAPYAFNVSTYELWVPLLRGGQIVVPPPGDLTAGALRDLIARERVTGLHVTAGLFRVLAEESPEVFAGVRQVLTGGDTIAPGAVQTVLDAHPGLVVRAMYGATEATVFSTHSAMTAPYRAGTTVSVGRPMDGVRLHVLDSRLRPVPAGEVGDVYLSGRGLARGYAGRPGPTAERFVANPFGPPGARMYRTGDLGRLSPEGTLDVVGRAGDLVKIAGYRVEPGEVEAVLAGHPSVRHAAVTARDAGPAGTRLVAYVVTDGPSVDSGALRAHLLGAVPDFMIPSAFVPVPGLPLTPNGKVDRRALPEPEFASGRAYRPPSTDTEKELCALFADVLGVERVGLDDSFFDLGGQSLSAMRLISRIRGRHGVDLTVGEFFDMPTPAELDRLLAGRKEG